MATPSVQILHNQWEAVKNNGLADELIRAAIRHGVQTDYVIAVGSRETNLKNILGDGDHGVGIIQVDIRFHHIAVLAKKNNRFKENPAPIIDYGVALLAKNIDRAAHLWPDFSADQHLKIAASAYNAGFGGAKFGVEHGDSDLRTAHGDYGRDVMKRRVIFHSLVSAHLNANPDLLKHTPVPAPYPED